MLRQQREGLRAIRQGLGWLVLSERVGQRGQRALVSADAAPGRRVCSFAI
jgi:hypothetical protein